MSGTKDKAALLNRLVISKADEQAPSQSLFKSPWVIAPLSLAIGFGLAYWRLEVPATESSSRSSSPEPVTISEAKPSVAPDLNERRLPQAGEQILNASGYVTARLTATVSSRVFGLIKSVDVEEGMRVEEGQILAQLDDAQAKVDLELAQAHVQSQRARLDSIQLEHEEATRVFNRQKELRAKNLTSEAELTRVKSDMDRLSANLRAARAEAEVAKFQVQLQQEILSHYTVRAPFAGVVTVKNAQPGEIISPSAAGGGFTRTGVCTIVDMDSLELEVDVNEAFIGRVFTGQKVIANLDAYPKWDIPASVIAVIPTADRSKATVKVRIAIEEKDSRVLPDMGAKVAFFGKSEQRSAAPE
jgi:RND family efflux transporter MFP subunit